MTGTLDVHTFEYNVLEWNDTLVRAAAALPVADLELQISVPRQTASRTHREQGRESEQASLLTCARSGAQTGV